MKYREYKQLNLSSIQEEVLEYWKEHDIFKKSITSREGGESFTFYEGPPSVNGLPGIHHALGRTVKDIFCRFKTLQGYQVRRKSGWDTHGLPVELQVEKRLGITKEDIGKKISVEDYNAECRKDVLKFKDAWINMTEKLGFWLDFDDVYITYDNNYIESLWHLLKRLFEKDLLYKDYTIQPYSPAAGTALSSHELNQPGTYKMVKDTSMTAQFLRKGTENEFFLAWTTTPWTLPSNTALAVGENIDYVKVQTLNPYTGDEILVYMAKELLPSYFDSELENAAFTEFNAKAKKVPWKIISEMKGSDLVGERYEQLLPYVQPHEGDPFKIIAADFVTTEDGTGIVHIAPTFGADDFRVGKLNNIPPLTVPDPENKNRRIPLVDKKGKFVSQMGEFAGRFVKNYEQNTDDYQDVNVDIAVKLKKENRAFRIEKYEHNYPHCWRTDRAVLYYPIEAWFIRTTAVKDKLIKLNKEINWKPKSTGEGRFGNWLENMVDWNLSRSRYWGTPLPIWMTEFGESVKCIGSYEELKAEVQKAIDAGVQQDPISGDFDPHRPYVDRVVLIDEEGRLMHRVPDVIDVWFDSGAMPYAQWHYPFENQDIFEKSYPADFIAEGVDQTRGWFYTLHAIAGMLFDSVAYKNVVANGLVLDAEGNKMSKRLGNAVDPVSTIDKYGSDATRWYMVQNAQLWENLKFDLNGLDEIRKKLFGTLHNVYSFYALYSNIDGFAYSEEKLPLEKRSELDRWIISKLNTLIIEVTDLMEDFEPTRAVRKIQDFVLEHLSNWYIRLCRRRFWKGDYTEDKIAAYQTLSEILYTISQLMSPFAPFYSDRLFLDLNAVMKRIAAESVHLSDWPRGDEAYINKSLESKMDLAQEITSLTLSLRKKAGIKVRQPLQKVMIPTITDTQENDILEITDLLKGELNLKEVEVLRDTSGVFVKKMKPNFADLGPRLGKNMKYVTQALNSMDQEAISKFEKSGSINIEAEGQSINLSLQDVEIITEDIPGWLVNSSDKATIALDVTITDELKNEGLAREFINRVQNMRKQEGYEVTDHIKLKIRSNDEMSEAIKAFKSYICEETLADELNLSDQLNGGSQEIDIEGNEVSVIIEKIN